MNTRSIRLATVLDVLASLLLFPILTIYAMSLKNTTPFMIGLALGIVGLAQLLATLPLIKIAQKIGTKAGLSLGFILIIAGSVLAMEVQTIEYFIVARFLQGAGAVFGVLLLCYPSVQHNPKKLPSHTKSAILGIGLAMILSLPMYVFYGDQSVFGFIAASALLSMILLLIRKENLALDHFDASVWRGSKLWSIYLSRLILLGLFTATFVILPIKIEMQAAVPQFIQIFIFALAVIVSIVLTFLMVLILKHFNNIKSLQVLNILFFALALLVIAEHLTDLGPSFIALVMLFTSLMTSLIIQSRVIESTVQSIEIPSVHVVSSLAGCLGVFLGGVLGAHILTNLDLTIAFALPFALCVVWVLLTLASPKIQN